MRVRNLLPILAFASQVQLPQNYNDFVPSRNYTILIRNRSKHKPILFGSGRGMFWRWQPFSCTTQLWVPRSRVRCCLAYIAIRNMMHDISIYRLPTVLGCMCKHAWSISARVVAQLRSNYRRTTTLCVQLASPQSYLQLLVCNNEKMISRLIDIS